jgi:hypothetical protein
MSKCLNCPNPTEGGSSGLCIPCEIEFAYRIMAAEPDPMPVFCDNCAAPYSLTEARVLREAKDPAANRCHHTPHLCWVCAHLHYAALRDAAT